MLHRAIGENEAPAGQRRQRRCERFVFMDDTEIDSVDEVEKLVGADIMFVHQPAHGRAVFDIISLLQSPRLVMVHRKAVANERRHFRIDLRKQLTLGGV